MKIGHPRVIFKLPQVLSHFQSAPRNWPKDHLAYYVEWYKVGKAGANHNMIKWESMLKMLTASLLAL